MDPNMFDQEESQQTLKPEEEKEKEESQNNIEKNSCSWMTERSKGKFDFHNYTGRCLCTYLEIFEEDSETF